MGFFFSFREKKKLYQSREFSGAVSYGGRLIKSFRSNEEWGDRRKEEDGGKRFLRGKLDGV